MQVTLKVLRFDPAKDKKPRSAVKAEDLVRDEARAQQRLYSLDPDGVGEIEHWVQTLHPDSRGVWIAGFSFGAWIGMQLLMRRPEVEGFLSIAPQPNLYDFSFLAPCPSSGLIINGTADRVAPPKDTVGLVNKLHEQKGIKITHTQVDGADHFFKDDEAHMQPMIQTVSDYVRRRMTEATR